MSSWLSVGKSFQQSKVQGEGELQVQVFESKDIPKQGAGVHDDLPSPERSKKKKSKSSKDEKRSKHHKKEKKRKRSADKDNEKHRRVRDIAEASRAEDSSSSSGFSSSDEDGGTQASKSRRLLRDTDILDGSSALTYLPNGEVVVLPRRKAGSEEGPTWTVDRRADRDMLLYDGMHPRDVVEYVMLPGVPYMNEGSVLPGGIARVGGHGQDGRAAGVTTMTSSQLYRASQQRPSGLMVSALKQHRDYEVASRTAQIFLHRQQLLTERRRELRLHHRHRYHSAAAKLLLEDPTLRRLSMRSGAPRESASLSVAVSLPLPYIDANIISELGFTAGNKKQQEPTSEDVNFATTAQRAQDAANLLLRETSLQLREEPHNVEGILLAVSAQDTVCIMQRLASGRPYNSLISSSLHRRAKSKADVAMKRDILDRKVDILKRAMDANRGSLHTQRVLRQQLVSHLHSGGRTEETDHAYIAARRDFPLDTETQLAAWAHRLGVFSDSTHPALVGALRSMYDQVTLSARNQQAAGELQQQVDASLQHHSGGAGGAGGSALQREYRQLSLEADLQRLRCDLLCLRLLLEQRAGHRERALATVQAMLDMNMHSEASVEDYCTYWDTECARLGEDVALFPPDYLVQDAQSALQEAPRTGYGAWVQQGRPDESVGNDFAEVGPSDDCRAVCARLGVKPDSQQEELLRARREAAFSVMERLSSPAAQEEVLGAAEEAETAEDDALNEAAADLFLSQVLGSAEEMVLDAESGDGDIDGDKQEDQSTAARGMPAPPRLSPAAPLPGGPEIVAAPAPQQGALVRKRSVRDESEAAEAEVESSAGAVAEGGDVDGMVYSRLHGYKIKLSAEDSGRIYRKILSEIAPNEETAWEAGEAGEAGAAENAAAYADSVVTGSRRRDDVFTPLHADNARFARYSAHRCADAVQWRPLKAVSARDADAVEQQPERVVFSDDIRASLFRSVLGNQPATPGSLGAALEMDVRQHLVVRCLQALGVHCRHSEASHSTAPRTAALLLPSSSATTWGEAHSRGGGAQTRQSGHHPLREAAVRALQSDGLASSLCVVDEDILRRHRLCARFGFDSQLNFVIRLIADVLRTVGASKDGIFSPGFVTHLRVVLVELLTARYQCAATDAHDPGTAGETAAEASPGLLLWRTQCRAVIESSVPHGNTASGANMLAEVPAVGSLEVWARYLSAEHALGHSGEATKLADKVLKSLSAGAKYPGHSALVLTAALQLALGLPLGATRPSTRSACWPALTQSQANTAVCLLVQCAHSGALRGDPMQQSGLNPKYGSYEGELKPVKKADKLKGGQRESAKLTAEAVRSAVEIYQNSVLLLVEAVQEDLRASDRARAEERRCEAVRVEVSDCSNINCGAEICQLVSLMAWLQYLSCKSAPTAVTTEDAVEVGDEVFGAAISLLRGLVLRAVPGAGANDSGEPGGSVPGKGYSRHLRRLLGEEGADVGLAGRSLAELCAMHGIASTSSAEGAVLVAVERLHRSRLQFLLIAYATAEVGQVRERRSALFTALRRAKSDFPYNAWFQQTFVTLAVAEPGGVLSLKVFLRGAAARRWLWRGGLSPTECVDLVSLEVLQAYRSVLILALGSGSCGSKDAVQTAMPPWAELLDISRAAQEQLVSRWPADAVQKVRGTLESVLASMPGCQMPKLWLFYIQLEASFGRKESAKKVFFRAVNQCGWSQDLYTAAAGPCLKASFSARELRSLESMLEQRGVPWLRACPT